MVKRRKKIDQRLTGAKLVDEQLQRVIAYHLSVTSLIHLPQLVTLCVRDYVESWYYQHISNDPHFIELVRKSASAVLINFATR